MRAWHSAHFPVARTLERRSRQRVGSPEIVTKRKAINPEAQRYTGANQSQVYPVFLCVSVFKVLLLVAQIERSDQDNSEDDAMRQLSPSQTPHRQRLLAFKKPSAPANQHRQERKRGEARQNVQSPTEE